MKRQFAALPYMVNHGSVTVCLITSRETKRWVIPKGWPITGLKGYEVAAQEAFEEAGLTGQVTKRALGFFNYLKRLDDASDVKCRVKVYPLRVDRQSPSWPEQDQRKLRWVKTAKAAKLVQEEELAALLRRFDPSPE